MKEEEEEGNVVEGKVREGVNWRDGGWLGRRQKGLYIRTRSRR